MRSDRTSEPGLADAASPRTGAGQVIGVVGAAWVLSLGFDFFLHAGLLAKLYVAPSPFLLQAEVAFRRIPLGYLSFLVLTLGLYWLFHRLGIRGVASGLRHGAIVGAVVWGALAIGLYSISTATLPLLAGWWIGQAIELGLAGAVLGAAAAGVPLKRIWTLVALAVFGCIAVTAVLQNLGLAPAMKLVRPSQRTPGLTGPQFSGEADSRAPGGGTRGSCPLGC